MTHKCFDIVKTSVLEKFVDGLAAGMWKITGLAFSHTRSFILRQRQKLPTTFLSAHICMNELMLIDDSAINDNANLGPCFFAGKFVTSAKILLLWKRDLYTLAIVKTLQVTAMITLCLIIIK